MVMGRQGLPSVKAVPACSQAGLVDGNRRETFINVYLSLVKDTPVLLKVIGKNCRAQQRRNPFGVLAGRPLARGARRQRRTVRSRSYSRSRYRR